MQATPVGWNCSSSTWCSVQRNYTVTYTTLANVLTEQTLEVPFKGIVRRLRAFVTAGTAILNVEVQFRQVTAGTNQNVPIATAGLVAQPADLGGTDGTSAYYELPDAAGAGAYLRNAFIAARVDNAAADHTVIVVLTIDAPAHTADLEWGS